MSLLTIVVDPCNYRAMPRARGSIGADDVFAALSDPTRRRVVQLLGAGPRRAGELAADAGTSAPTMSRHLRVLLDAGIVSDTRPSDDARTRVFRLRPESMVALQAWLDQLEAHWDEQLGAYRRHVTARSGR
jgi:DNA-binding transcriptional ArsR family regulator